MLSWMRVFLILVAGTSAASEEVPVERLTDHYLVSAECSLALAARLEITDQNAKDHTWVELYLAEKKFKKLADIFARKLIKRKVDMREINKKLTEKATKLDTVEKVRRMSTVCLYSYRVQQRLKPGI